ncbi:cysteine dioxygenase type 1-like protein [Dinothrombium tinctorium]|uniref:Cysteine dioxygenase n=1 Tax=Dinothrombium tinctorium TaxID=1965070 RepID=A0A3S3PCM8_9ACAR|nr:cysteine dioxygenase type 1-like protein [Dinothrombium tinctorium]
MDLCKSNAEISCLDELVVKLREIFSQDDIDVDYVQQLMLSYKSNPRDWRKYAHFDRHRYTRNLVDEGNGRYNLMLLAWSEGQGSSIHDHSNAHCFMKVLAGSLREIRYDWPKEEHNLFGDDGVKEMKMQRETTLNTNDVAYINDSIGLHRVENESHTQPAVSLHLYIPPFNSCRTFDQRTGHCNKVTFTFHSKYGKRTPFVVSVKN